MNLSLARLNYGVEGIVGELLNYTNSHVCFTLEHAYSSNTGYEPKLPRGIYTCQRGQHQLAHMSAPFTTFEITSVPNHTNILFHVGNFNEDSEGCVLLGTSIQYDPTALSQSRVAFNKFMELQTGIDSFTLTVI